MKKITMIGLIVVSFAGITIYSTVQANQKAAIQTTTINFKQEMSAMTLEMKKGNTDDANTYYDQARSSMAKIMNHDFKSQDWIARMTKQMNQNKSELSAMMSNKDAVNEMISAMQHGDTQSADSDYHQALKAMETVMKDTNLKKSDGVAEMERTMEKYQSQLSSMMSSGKKSSDNSQEGTVMMTGKTSALSKTSTTMMGGKLQ